MVFQRNEHVMEPFGKYIGASVKTVYEFEFESLFNYLAFEKEKMRDVRGIRLMTLHMALYYKIRSFVRGIKVNNLPIIINIKMRIVRIKVKSYDNL